MDKPIAYIVESLKLDKKQGQAYNNTTHNS